MKITIGINSLVSTTHSAYGNHINVFYRLGRSYPDINFVLVNPPRMSIDRFRNMAAEVALYEESDYLLFLDDDILVPIAPPFDFLRKLIAADADIVAGDVIIRSYPFDHMLFNYSQDKLGLHPIKDIKPEEIGLIEVGAVGFSLCLIKTSLLKQVSKPYFVTGVGITEDIYFCLKVKREIKDVVIKADTTIQCAHILWEETISSYNKENYKLYYEKQYKPQKIEEDQIKSDRGDEYLNHVNEAVELQISKEFDELMSKRESK